MGWRESLARAISKDPTRESEALRGDIVDELDDHLTCAMQRELRRTDDEEEAEGAVLERFGDPRKVARQLWWDAMKEKIMRDRILFAVLAIICVASLLVSVAVLRAVQEGQQVNQAMLARIADLSMPATPNELTGDWSMAMVTVVSDGDAKPMAGVTVQLKGHIFNPTDIGELSSKSDKDGVAKIGPIKAGQYEFFAWSNDHSAKYMNFAFYPGRTNEFTLVAPKAERASAQVKFDITCPDTLDKSDLVLAIAPTRTDKVKLGTWDWSPPQTPQLFMGMDGKILSVSGNNQNRQLTVDSTKESNDSALFAPGSYRILSWQLYVVEPEQQERKPRQLISVNSYSEYYSSLASFTAKTGEEARVKLDLTKAEARPSYPKKSLQDQKEAAIEEFMAKKKTAE